MILLQEMEEQQLLIAFEIDMCCGEDYIVKELTQKAKRTNYYKY